MSALATVPTNIEAERCLVSCLLANPRDLCGACAEWQIGPEAFIDPTCEKIVRHVLAEWAENRPCDPQSVLVGMRGNGRLDDNGSSFFEIVHTCPVPSAFAQFAAPVLAAHQLREAHQACVARADEALVPGTSAADLLSGIAEDAARIAGASRRGTTKPLKTLLMEKIARMESGEADEGLLLTGIAKLDRMSPLHRGDMPLISGERKSGKSIFALNVATNLALGGCAVGYFSLEDRTPKVIDRLFAIQSRIPLINHHASRMNEGEFQRTTAAVAELADKRMFIRDDVFDLMPIIAVMRQWKAQHPDLAAVVVDYAQLVRVRLGKGANREQEVATISRAFRLASMELNIALLLLCQLNKDGDTRESKALEQDCTAMWKIMLDGEEHGKRIIGIPFQRNGDMPLAFPVTFLGHIAKIEEFVEEPKAEKRNYHDR